MTLLLIEGFDHFSNYTRKGWQSTGPTGTSSSDTLGVSAPGRVAALAGQCMKVSVRSNCNIGACAADRSIYKLFPVSSTEVILGFGIYTDGNVPSYETPWPSGNNNVLVNLIDANRNTICKFYLTDVQIPVVGGVASASPHTHGVWTYYEIRAKVAGASSEVEMKRNGGDDVPTTIVNLGTAPIAGVEFATHALNTERYFYVDDVYCLSVAGAAPRNDFLGDVRVETLYPIADGAHKEWTRSAGATNYSLVDEHPENDDTDYVTSNTPDQIDTYVTSDLSSAGVVYGVQANMIARKTTAGFKQVQQMVREGGADYAGAAKTLAAAYGWYGHIFETDPAGGEWTTAKVNADEFGVKVVV